MLNSMTSFHGISCIQEWPMWNELKTMGKASGRTPFYLSGRVPLISTLFLFGMKVGCLQTQRHFVALRMEVLP